MNKLLLGGLLIVFLLWQQACIAPYEEQLTDVNLDYRDSLFQEIANFQDQALKDSLLNFLDHPNPSYRYQAIMAFASIRDTAMITPLTPLLEDNIDKVRAAAAYAIGQLQLNTAASLLTGAFDQSDTAGHYKLANKAILEAIGKSADQEYLDLLSTIETYESKDSALLEGQAWGIYRYALRKMVSPKGTARMAELLNPTYPEKVRLIAANYFFRAEGLELSDLGLPLTQAFQAAADPEIRMALAIGLGKTQQDTALSILLKTLPEEKDYRVRCNIIRAFTNFPYERVSLAVFSRLQDDSPQVRLRATQYFLEKGESQDAGNYWRRAKVTSPWQAQLTLYAAANRHLAPAEQEAKNILNRELRNRFFRAQMPYEKAAAIQALAEFPWNYRFIQREGYKDTTHIVRGASVQALSKIANISNFKAAFGNAATGIAQTLAKHFQTAIASGDAYMMYPAASALQSDNQDFSSMLSDLTFLDNAIGKLELPGEVGLFNSLQATKAKLSGQAAPSPSAPGYDNAIQWEHLSELDLTPEAIIKTNKGDISIELLPNIAPGSVANFLQLIKDGFYEGRTFHRVIPNFVAQVGEVKPEERDDINYNIRSEISELHYDQAGWVGMAHAGSNTESTHFFVTHSPTPHLDGNYTIFARLKSGEDVLHNLMIGDAIERITIH